MATEEDISIDSDGNLVVKRREVQKDISVNEEQIEVGGSDVDLDSFESELEEAMSSALESMEEVNIEADADRADSTDDGDSGGGKEDAAEPKTEEKQETDGDDESGADLTVEEAVDQSEEIIEEEEITSQNWNTFSSAWDERGVSDSSFLSDVWGELKERDMLKPVGGEEESDEEADDSESESESETDKAEDTSDDGSRGVGMAGSVQDSEDVFLIVNPGDEESDEAIDQFSDMIEAGDIQTVNAGTSTEAASMMSQAGISSAPALVLETDEGFVELGEEMEGEQEQDDPEEGEDSEGGEEKTPDEDGGGGEDSGSGELPITPEEAAEKWPTANRNAFNSGCLSGDSEPQLGMGVCSQLWSEIEERGLGEAGDGSDDTTDSSGGSGGGGGKFSQIAPDDVDESEVEDAYLVYKEDSDAGQQALEQFSGFISDGVLKKAEFFNSPMAGTIRNELDDFSTPALVLDMGGGDFVEVN